MVVYGGLWWFMVVYGGLWWVNGIFLDIFGGILMGCPLLVCYIATENLNLLHSYRKSSRLTIMELNQLYVSLANSIQ